MRYVLLIMYESYSSKNGTDTLQVLYRYFKMINDGLVFIQVFWSLITRFYNLDLNSMVKLVQRPNVYVN